MTRRRPQAPQTNWFRGPLAVGLCGAALSLPSTARAEGGDHLTISVLTFGPGDHPFYKFGHNAIWVHDEHLRGPRGDAVYNYGTFMLGPLLIPEFLKGRLIYWLSVQSLDSTIRMYKEENRTIESQELNLTPAQRLELSRRLYENAKFENREYRYDYYRDNCSTRVRDMVDGMIHGRLHDVSRGPASMTFREHTLRLTADDVPIYLGLNVAMSDVIDAPIDVWGEMFLPAKVQETLRKATVLDADGKEIPLVKSETTLLEADNRAPVRTAPPRWIPHMALAGGVIGAVLALLGHSAAAVRGAGVAPSPEPPKSPKSPEPPESPESETPSEKERPVAQVAPVAPVASTAAPGSRGARIAFGVALSVLGTLIGGLGCIFVLLWAFTDHQVAYHNENILQCAPWAVALLVLGVKVARNRAPAIDRSFKLVAAAAGASVLGLLLQALPWFDQVNGQIIALALPVWVGMAAGLWWLRTGRTAA